MSLGSDPVRKRPGILDAARDLERSAASWFLVLPLLQTENLVASLVVGLVAFVMSGRLMTRWLMLALWVGLSCYLVLDQVYYKTFFDHFRPSSIEGAAEIGSVPLLGSIMHELDLRFCFNSIVVIGCTALLAWRCVFGPQRALPARPRWVVRLLPVGAMARCWSWVFRASPLRPSATCSTTRFWSWPMMRRAGA